MIKMKYIQNRHEACEQERHQRSEVLAVEPQSELDLIKKIVYLHFEFSFNSKKEK